MSALDLSEAALRTARMNANRHRTDIRFILSDINDYAGEIPLDLIISNPPYIPDAEAANMHINVLMHEPQMALFVPDDEPLGFYEVIGEI
ncbi:methyltransferase, partial [Klebsiella pneumoniae]|nr:methyltransferase [Klebsiella pneumoniae]